MSRFIGFFVDFYRAWVRPGAKQGEPEMASFRFRLVWLIFGILLIVGAWAWLLARHDPGEAARSQASDWLSRTPMAWATLLQVAVAWILLVLAVDSTKLAKWAFHWNKEKPDYRDWLMIHGRVDCPENRVIYDAEPFELTEPDLIRAAKTRNWGLFLSVSLLATAWVISKCMGA